MTVRVRRVEGHLVGQVVEAGEPLDRRAPLRRLNVLEVLVTRCGAHERARDLHRDVHPLRSTCRRPPVRDTVIAGATGLNRAFGDPPHHRAIVASGPGYGSRTTFVTGHPPTWPA